MTSPDLPSQDWIQNQPLAADSGATVLVETDHRDRTPFPIAKLAVALQQPFILVGGLRRRATIGRDDTCEISLPSAGVSRRHAALSLIDADWQIEDLDSKNGVYVNGERITTRLLRHHDQIRLGSIMLRFETAPSFFDQLNWVQSGVELGIASAQSLMGWMLLNRVGVDHDPTEAMRLLRLAAAAGQAAAAIQLGVQCATGTGGAAADDAEALVWFQAAARCGDAEGEYWLGRCLAEGRATAVDLAQACRWWRRAAEQGHLEAQYRLGAQFGRSPTSTEPASDRDPPVSAVEAARWLEMAAARGHTDAEYRVGILFAQGIGVEQNYATAYDWLRQAAAKGHPEAEFDLSGLCRDGRGTSADLGAARYWLHSAAEHGHAEAQLQIALESLSDGEPPADPGQAMIWLRQAADRGSAAAAYRLAILQLSEPQEPAAADPLGWLARAADLGEPAALYVRAVRRLYGLGCERAPQDAATDFRASAKAGVVDANFALGLLLVLGVIGEAVPGEAGAALATACGRGHRWAPLFLGNLRWHGLGPDRDPAGALEWYRQAAQRGVAEASFRLGLFSFYGLGGTADPAGAITWFDQAERQGHAEAGTVLEILAAFGLVGATERLGPSDRFAAAATIHQTVDSPWLLPPIPADGDGS